jgi:hypothetical protein
VSIRVHPPAGPWSRMRDEGRWLTSGAVRKMESPFCFSFNPRRGGAEGRLHAAELKQTVAGMQLANILSVTAFRIKSLMVSTLWLAIVSVCMVGLWRYRNASGDTLSVPPHWPAGAAFVPDPAVDTLVLFAHPKCPCTRATVGELNRLMAKCEGRVAVHVLFFNPREFSDEWTKTSLWRDAARIPGVSVHEDRDGAQARLFGAATSGFVAVYDPKGNLRFSGGITGSRGHAGDNLGEDTIEALVNGRPASVASTPVYGCSLLNCELPLAGASR